MYKITKINTLTHVLTIKLEDGSETAMIIPPTHRGSNALKHEYIRSQSIPKQNIVIEPPIAEQTQERTEAVVQQKKPPIGYTIPILVGIIAVLLLLKAL